MKFITILMAVFYSYSALAADVSVLLGTPDRTQPFVNQILVENFPVRTDNSFEEIITTSIFYVLFSKGIDNARSFAITNAQGRTNESLFNTGIELASNRSNVVLTPMGPFTNHVCRKMAEQFLTAFVLAAGNDGNQLTQENLSECNAPNILIVAGLDQETGNSLIPSSGWGKLVRIAAPARNILTQSTGGQYRSFNGTTMPAALVAAELAKHGDHHLQAGARLVSDFLEHHTVLVPALENRVREGRVLRQ